MALWGCLGQAANITQLAGVDILGIITLIVKGVLTVRRNQEECRQLSSHASMMEDLLRRLVASEVIEHPETWKPILGLRGTLIRAYMLVRSCQHSSYAYHFCMGCEVADQLHSVRTDMGVYISYLSALLHSINYDELTVIGHTTQEIRNALTQDGGQVPAAAGSSAYHFDRNYRGTVGFATVQLVTESSIVNEGHLPENQRSRWCCWCPWKETSTAPNINMLIGHRETGPAKFTFSQLARATSYFSLKNAIGFGGSSIVYKGRLHDGLEVAVKRASCQRNAPFSHFESEIELIPKLRHANIVKLLGYCSQKSERILVFEYMPNGSLDSFIYGERAMEAPLDWPKRCQIVEGIAQGALYLHKLCGPHIIHGDLKPGNILLDSDLNPNICDFGISRALRPGADVDCTGVVAGSRGFIAPEYKRGGCLSVKSDVYSFGATLLQIISGKKLPPPPLALADESRDYGPMNKWAWDLWVAGRLLEFIDPSLHREPRKAEIMRWVQIGLLCVQERPEERPSMWDVLMMLSCENSILRQPNMPAYY
ncbi:cysteine-rich receptor-like protein kinase 44 [Phragmites australis]|uniref:cysteine-rich receptor-like protein kinase 44 n=1 Tax=Phragmites australis TaxID=29695 RepID=UPI002D79A011|nr:cysteine-rich receptor-like protein kinase 44 [Phragmites australis]